ncbi:MAG: S41 family peptidase [Pirellulaceae bacterium]|nr:S41 family peptidase [Pirellulaceae bacterium]
MVSSSVRWWMTSVLSGIILASSLAAGPSAVWADTETPGVENEPQTAASEQQDDQAYYELFKLLADTLDQVERNYVKPVDRRRLVDAAIRGMLTELDPYSSYIPPAQLDRFRSGVEAEFGGVGIQVTVDKGQLRVISPIVGSPAYRSGMMSGDVIVEIDGRTAQGITIDEAVERMKGKPGTEVTVKILHPGATEPQVLTLQREVIRVETVLGDTRGEDASWKWMIDDERKIGYVRVTAFGRHTSEELRKAVGQLVDQGLRGLVLDLRFNPGGLLTSAIEVSDMFIAEGRIVSTEGRNTPTRTWDAKGKDTYPDFPMVVLINRYSASASEIVAACLQDHQRAVVIGERSWGKGSVQNVVELEEGVSALKLTTADYRRPSGKNIHRFPDATDDDTWGVMPDDGYELKMSTEELTLLAAERRKKDIIRRPGDAPVDVTGEELGDNEGDDAEVDSPPPSDRQLGKALEYLVSELNPPANDGGETDETAAKTAAAQLEKDNANLDARDDL